MRWVRNLLGRLLDWLRPLLLRWWERLRDRLPFPPTSPPPPTLTVTDFTPVSGHPGCVLVITGTGFDPTPQANTVTVGGAAGLVYAATDTELSVITGGLTRTGPVEVTVGADTATGPRDFVVLPHPTPGSGDDGPPIAFAGSGTAGPAAGAPTSGVLKVLVALVNPTDEVPADGATARTNVVDLWDSVSTFYDRDWTRGG